MQNIDCVLGIETSCDETAVAVYSGKRGLIAHQIYSQIPLHAQYGGVVPELASRDHIQKTTPLIQQALVEANLSPHEIDGVAYTKGPGLVGALMVGAAIGRSLGYAWQVPTIGVHHLEGHILAVMLEEKFPEPPFVALLVSGGHTQLMSVEKIGEYCLLGETLDDAVGEAFDKTAKLLGLPYPGGAALSALAEQGHAKRFSFPRPMTKEPGLNFSFSGLKTHVVNLTKQHELDMQCKADIAAGFQAAAIDTLVIKRQRALDLTHFNQLVVVGGVGANQNLRQQLATTLEADVYYPRREFCTDNAAMIAYAGYLRLQAGEREPLSIEVKPRWPFT